MAMNFPASPTDGETIAGPNGVTWTWDGTKWTFTPSTGGGGATQVTFILGGAPLAADQEVIVPIVVPMTIPANLAGSLGVAIDNPAAAASLILQHISGGASTTIGTVAISTAGAVTFSGSGGDIAAGDFLAITAPATADASLGNVSISLLATRA